MTFDLTAKFECPNKKVRAESKIHFKVLQDDYYDDSFDEYLVIEKCSACGERHVFLQDDPWRLIKEELCKNWKEI